MNVRPFVLVWDACDLEPTWSYVDVVLSQEGATITTGPPTRS